MMRRRWWFGFAVVVLISAAGCAGDPVSQPAPIAASGPPATPAATAAPGTPAEPFQAARADPMCGLVPGRTDFTDLLPTTVPSTYPPRTIRPAPGSIDAHTTPVFHTLDVHGSAFVVGAGAVAFLDPDRVDTTEVVRVDGPCNIWTAAGDAVRLALQSCPGPRTFDTTGCQVVVRVDDHAAVAWTLPPGQQDLAMTWDGPMLVAAGGSWIARIDPVTGTGTIIRAMPGCPNPGVNDVIAHTRFAHVVCTDGTHQERVVVDAATGEVVDSDDGGQPLGTITHDLASDGREISGFGQARRDAETFAVTGPDAAAPAFEAVVKGATLPVTAIEVPGGVWVARCSRPCTPTSTVGVEIQHLDGTTATVTDTWTATDTLVTRETDPVNVRLMAADEHGAWYTVAQHLYRLNRRA